MLHTYGKPSIEETPARNVSWPDDPPYGGTVTVFKISKLFILFKLFLWHIVGEVKRGLEMATGRQGVLKIPGTRLRMEPATAS